MRVERTLADVLDVFRQQLGVFSLEPPVLQNRSHPVGQSVPVEGFEQVVRSAEFHRVYGGRDVDDAGDDEYVLLRVPLLDALDEFGPVHAGHHQVCQHEVEVGPVQDPEGLLAARCRPHIEALFGERPGNQLAEVALVVDRED